MAVVICYPKCLQYGRVPCEQGVWAKRFARNKTPSFALAKRGPSKPSKNLGNLDGPIRASRFADSRESLDSRESFQGSRTEPLFFGESRLGGGLKIANRRFEAIRANRAHVGKMSFFLRIDSRESPRFAARIAGPSKLGNHPKKLKSIRKMVRKTQTRIRQTTRNVSK